VPISIECYDISHLQGSLGVASRVSFVDARPHKSGYRRYKLRETAPGDDYGAMREVLRRRLEKLESEPAPDLLLLDGGKGQLNAARALFADLGVEGIALASLAKERDEDSASGRVMRHGGQKREKLFLPGVKDPIMLARDSAALLLLQRVRDESHRFAITYHRELRKKSQFRSILDELPGIGPMKRRALLRQFGSLEKIRAASLEELEAVPKLGRRAAAIVHRFFHAELPGSVAAAVKNDSTAADPIPEPDSA
jgi:excinuclease ABC subunit C